MFIIIDGKKISTEIRQGCRQRWIKR